MNTATTTKRRFVTNEEFRIASEGIPGDPASIKAATDNWNVINAVTRKYAGQIDADTLNRCALHGLWRALGYHRDGFNQKFTTSLHRFVKYECCRVLRKTHRPKIVSLHETSEEKIVRMERKGGVEDISHIKECMHRLCDEHRHLIEQHFFQGMNVSQIAQENCYTKETARQRLGVAITTLTQICRSSLGQPV